VLVPAALFAATSAAANMQRGRVRIVDHVVVADNGALLRGASGNSMAYGQYKNLSWWTDVRDAYRLNTIRMFVYCCSPVDSSNVVDLNTLASHLDVAVKNARMAGMYLILNLYNRDGFSRSVAEAVWAELAPRYKDDPHVIYEIFNEPVHWAVSEISASDIRDQVDMYAFIRSRAPDTHIIMWTPAHINDKLIEKVNAGKGIDYSNASVGYHPYATSDYGTVAKLRAAGYPVIATEMSRAKGRQYVKPFFDYQEQNGVSWIYLDLSVRGGNSGTPVLHPSEWPRTWPTDPFYTKGAASAATRQAGSGAQQ
jgi:hypothetical protein